RARARRRQPRRPDLLVRMHVLRGLRRRARRMPELRRRARGEAAARPVTGARHLYVHLPFCSSRCGYCDFVTVVGRDDDHHRYVAALLRELDLERDLLGSPLESVYLGGGTPSLTAPAALEALLAALPAADELTIEAN